MYTNYGDISLAVAVWLAADDGYDLKYHPRTISATTLLKPIRSIVLTRRMRAEQKDGSIDISDLVPSRVGTAVHTAAEIAWLESREKAFSNLKIPKHVQDRIYLNADSQDDPDGIYIYMENRTTREIDGWTISGKYDFVVEGRVEDMKTTKVYNWIHGGNDSKYALQESIYRWLNPDIITEDECSIHFVFTDWSPLQAQIDKTYPQKRIMTRTLPLRSIEGTEHYIRGRLALLTKYDEAKQEELPQCTPDELWMAPPTYAYYKDRNKLTRSTKNFDNAAEANARCAADGGVGVVMQRLAEPKFCKFCDARPACTQAERFINDGILKL